MSSRSQSLDYRKVFMSPINTLFSDNLTRNRQSTFSPLTPFIPLPKYFESEWSYAQYRIPVQSSHISISGNSRSNTADVPDEERCVVGWVEVPSETDPSLQVWGIIALTYSGGWYRLSLPAYATSSQSSTATPSPLSSSPPRLGPMSQPRTSSPSSVAGRDKGKEKERDRERKDSRECILREFRRFGRWDGWG